jgi:hypothetical protein
VEQASSELILPESTQVFLEIDAAGAGSKIVLDMGRVIQVTSALLSYKSRLS